MLTIRARAVIIRQAFAYLTRRRQLERAMRRTEGMIARAHADGDAGAVAEWRALRDWYAGRLRRLRGENP